MMVEVESLGGLSKGVFDSCALTGTCYFLLKEKRQCIVMEFSPR